MTPLDVYPEKVEKEVNTEKAPHYRRKSGQLV